jgi:hypothetical protein
MLFISKKLTVALVSIACIGGFVFATGTNLDSRTQDINVEASTGHKIVFVDKSYIRNVQYFDWWTTDDTFIGQTHTAAGIKSWNTTKLTKISDDSDDIFYGQLNQASTEFEFFVYNTDSSQNKTTYFSGAILTNIRNDTYNYFYITSANGSAVQTGNWTKGHPTANFLINKYTPGTLNPKETITVSKKFVPSIGTITNPTVSGFTFDGWYTSRAYTTPSTIPTNPWEFDNPLNLYGKYSPNDAYINQNFLRIPVVSPTFWNESSAYQVLRIANDSASLVNNTLANITIFEMKMEITDSYYNDTVVTGFDEYATNGIMFYDIPISAIVGKYVDLVRYAPDSDLSSTLNIASLGLYQNGMNNAIWRIWSNGGGIYRPLGDTAESRNIDDASVAKILEGYLTCRNDQNNGFAAFNDLNNHFNLTGRNYAGSTIIDYDGIGTTNYTSGRGTGKSTSIENKIAYMEALYEAANPSGAGYINIQTQSFRLDLMLIILIIPATLFLVIYSYQNLYKNRKALK